MKILLFIEIFFIFFKMTEILPEDIFYKFDLKLTRSKLLDFAYYFAIDVIHDLCDKHSYKKGELKGRICTKYLNFDKYEHLDIFLGGFQSIFFINIKDKFNLNEINDLKERIKKHCNKSETGWCAFCGLEKNLFQSEVSMMGEMPNYDYEYIDAMYASDQNAYPYSKILSIEYNANVEYRTRKEKKRTTEPKFMVRYVECVFIFVDNNYNPYENPNNKPSIIYNFSKSNNTGERVFMVNNNIPAEPTTYYQANFFKRDHFKIKEFEEVLDQTHKTMIFNSGTSTSKYASQVNVIKQLDPIIKKQILFEKLFSKFVIDFSHIMIFKALSDIFEKLDKKINFISDDNVLRVIANKIFGIKVYNLPNHQQRKRTKNLIPIRGSLAGISGFISVKNHPPKTSDTASKTSDTP